VLSWTAGVARSGDEGMSWSDVTPRPFPPETNDPYLYVDPATGRVFSFHMFPLLTCATVSFSDDGGDTWTTNPAGCGPTGIWDHQTMVAAAPRTLTPVGYPNIVHQCVNAIYAAMCSRSLDGGRTWSPSTPAFLAGRSGTSLCALHGHLAAAADGTLYLPTTECGNQPTVYVSRDDGLTWRRSVVTDASAEKVDPAVAVDAAGNVYVTWQDPNGKLQLSVSRDLGTTWSAPVAPAPLQLTGALPAIVAGDAGHIAIAFPGTADLPDGAASPRDSDATISWGGYMIYSTTAADPDPSFTTIRTTGDDPLMEGERCAFHNGRCAVQWDFIGAAVTPDGRPFAAMVDACPGKCGPGGGGVSDYSSPGVVVTVEDADLCAERCWMFAPADTPPPPPLATSPGNPHDPLSGPALALQGHRATLREALAAGRTQLLPADVAREAEALAASIAATR
jgi:hypothetical protein